jgi:tetratricopeptide (TPR) repeat protein
VNDRDASARLRLKIANAYARCGDYAEAARTSEGILVDLPRVSLYGKVMATHLGYLAKDDNVEQVVAATGPVLDDSRCGPYLGQILYLRWWALRKTNRPDEAAGIAQRLLDQHPDDSCVGPILLERAMDALTRQEYERCHELLTRLTRDLAGTESAKRGLDILRRLQNSGMQERDANEP